MSDQPNNVKGSIQNMLGGSTGYTRFRAKGGDELQIGGVLNVVTDQGTTGDIQINGGSLVTRASAATVTDLTGVPTLTFPGIGTRVDIAGTNIAWTLNSGNINFSLNDATKGEYIYTGTNDITVKMAGYLTFSTITAVTTLIDIAIAINGTVLDYTSVDWDVLTTGDPRTLVIPTSIATISTGDLIKIQAANNNNTNSISLFAGTLTVFD